MRMSENEKMGIYKELESLASEMNYSVDGVIVEGAHDKKTLGYLGYKGPIFKCSSRSFRLELVDFAARGFAKMVILTDFDEAGETLNKNLTKLLENEKVKVEHSYRGEFRRLLTTARISTIEGIYRLKLELFRK